MLAQARLDFPQLNAETANLYLLIEPAQIHATSMADAARIDPDTGKVAWIPLPFDAEDMAFDMDGRFTWLMRPDAGLPGRVGSREAPPSRPRPSKAPPIP